MLSMSKVQVLVQVIVGRIGGRVIDQRVQSVLMMPWCIQCNTASPKDGGIHRNAFKPLVPLATPRRVECIS